MNTALARIRSTVVMPVSKIAVRSPVSCAKKFGQAMPAVWLAVKESPTASASYSPSSWPSEAVGGSKRSFGSVQP